MSHASMRYCWCLKHHPSERNDLSRKGKKKKIITAYVFLNADKLRWHQQPQQDLLSNALQYISTIR